MVFLLDKGPKDREEEKQWPSLGRKEYQEHSQISNQELLSPGATDIYPANLILKEMFLLLLGPSLLCLQTQ